MPDLQKTEGSKGRGLFARVASFIYYAREKHRYLRTLKAKFRAEQVKRVMDDQMH